ncbi:MAG: Gfo/Idh/MocA family oxidoreductase [Planctomycetota bacterium]|nr:Gfo/Idh/MocA family oxidoreductase [Planctomycetota bacterium]
MSRIKTIVVGAGHLGRIHTRLANSLDIFDVVGVVDPSSEARNQFQAELGIQGFESIDQVPETLEAAIVAAPTGLHYPICQSLLEQGTHVLVEKPITVTTDEAKELVELADRSGAVLQVGHVERFNPAFEKLKEKVSHAKFIETRRMSEYTFRSTDVGVVLDLMIHDIDLILSLVESDVKQVDAVGISIMGENEDIAQARLEFEDGAVAQLVASRCSFSRQRTIQVFSDRSFAQADLTTRQVQSIAPGDAMLSRAVDFLSMPAESQQQVRETLFTEWLPKYEQTAPEQNAILEEHKDFAESIVANRVPRVCGRQGSRALEVAHAVMDEIQGHHWYGESLPVSGPLAMPFPRLLKSGEFHPEEAQMPWVAQTRKAG